MMSQAVGHGGAVGEGVARADNLLQEGWSEDQMGRLLGQQVVRI